MRYERSFQDALQVAQKRGTRAALMQEKKLLKLVRAKEDEIRFQALETIFFWDGKGNIVLSRTGSADQVSFTRQELTAINPVISTHNHPSGTKYPPSDPRYGSNSFSLSDVKSACLTKLRELRVVSPQYRYSLKPPQEGWDIDYFDTVLRPEFDALFYQTRREFIAQVQKRTVMPHVAGIILLHEVWTRLAARLGLQYARYED